jgi:hypothetical protein
LLKPFGKYLLIKKGGFMPNQDGTGPAGKGSKTGRGLGNCKPATQNEENTERGKGLGKGHGAGKGAGNGAGKGKGNQHRGGK